MKTVDNNRSFDISKEFYRTPKEILHEYEAILNKEYIVKTRDV